MSSKRIEHILIVGFGCIGQAILPLLSHAYPDAAITVLDRTMDAHRLALARQYRAAPLHATVTAGNHPALLGPLLGPQSFLLNLAPAVCSRDLIALAQAHQSLYLDSGIEPWDYEDGMDSIHLSNYALRSEMLAFARGRERMPTALVAHGANPGLVSLLVKAALLKLARHAGLPDSQPADQAAWAGLARRLDVRVIQVAEYDSQSAPGFPAPGEFANTWSADGFITECLQDAELGWGSHERGLPPGGRRHGDGSDAAIALDRPGHRTRVRSWSALHGPFEAWLITHNESISLAEYLTCATPGEPLYRPTVYYAYRPTRATLASMQWLDERGASRIASHRILKDEIDDGVDELGVLLMSGCHGAVWHGSQLDVQRARRLAPHNSATSLQVASSIVAGMRWAQANPARGVTESDALDYQPVLEQAAGWWAPMVTRFTDWTPVPGRRTLSFDEFLLTAPAPRDTEITQP
ncbi:saccharopine dehydrogenase C-terminal domain-containing protein [Cupriavidus basilensis]|uniref:Saccharopine dehydrogenase C-terminal domain-containing protein n=1 Tax=Cupriavidus basilensis TaxID=68895 RepID=A0ABT6AJS2_9BURK|nr:saccharopine dehydrogenase C-terminal domain-containing protein [Cupriavidus basilensis]MDF3832557.1 saccharopine dehydrogenase C-terminal domain-containing protein [Cupriavidus basilensis]